MTQSRNNEGTNSNDNTPSNSNDNRPLATGPLSVMSILSSVSEKLVTALRKLNDSTTSLCTHKNMYYCCGNK